MENIQGSKRKILGTCKKTGESIYFYKPTWDCDWYWGFGYLGNKNQHYHLSDYANGRNINMYDALIGDYDLNENIKKNLWKFCEVAKTIYTLITTAEVLGRGSSNYTHNPFEALIQNKAEVERINEVVLPQMIQYLYDMFDGK